MVRFVDENREELGVEPICKELQVAPSTYYAAKSRQPSARTVRDAVMIPILLGLWQANYSVYGTRKLWRAAVRSGHDLGRDQVARLMRQAQICGVRRGKKFRTTVPDPNSERPSDLVNRVFSADRPNALWVTDLTYVATWSGFAYVCFITDCFSRMIVGWRVASNMRTDMVLDALEMARWRRGTVLEGLIAHSDAGSQYTSIRYGERLADLGATPSVGSVGDCLLTGQYFSRSSGQRVVSGENESRPFQRSTDFSSCYRQARHGLLMLHEHRPARRCSRRRSMATLC
jgi:putative transposase